MIRNILRVVVLGLLLAAAAPVVAGIVNETGGNNTLATAQNVDAFFTLDFSDDIGDKVANTSTKIPHVTIFGKGDATGDGSFDYYSFTTHLPNSTVIFDIDHTKWTNNVALDTEILAFSPTGTFYGSNNDSDITWGALGSTRTADSYLEVTFPTAGLYVIGVARYHSIPLGNPNPGIGGTFLKAGDEYTLQISVPVPEPSTLALATLGVFGVFAAGRRFRRR
ncbi:MAG: PEP-CTERM sorting domain-containing protein [Pirellulales bacterium]